MLRRKPRKRPDRRSLRTLVPWRGLPAHPPPPPPVQTVAVLRVIRFGETSALWVFDKPVTNPNDLDGFRVDGHPGWDWFRDGENVLVIEHAGATTVGLTWSNDAGAGGVVGLEGEELVAGSGTVQAE